MGAPAFDQKGKKCAVGPRIDRTAFSLVPECALDAEGRDRIDHAIKNSGRRSLGLRGRRLGQLRKRAIGERRVFRLHLGQPILGNRFGIGHAQPEAASEREGIVFLMLGDDAQGNYVGARFDQTSGNKIIPKIVPVIGRRGAARTNLLTIEIGGVRFVNHAGCEMKILACSFRGQLDCLAKPDDAAVGHADFRPIAWTGGRNPVLVVKGGVGPFGGEALVLGINADILLLPGLHVDREFFGVSRQILEFLEGGFGRFLQAGNGVQVVQRDKRLDPHAAPAASNQADRNSQLTMDIGGEIVTNRGEAADRRRGCHLPSRR